MLELLAAISVASAIVRFVEFGAKVIAGNQELYQSNRGALPEHVELGNIITEVVHLNDMIILTRPTSQTGGLAEEDQAISELGNSCEVIMRNC